MDVLRILDVVGPVLAVAGLVVLTYGLGRIVLTQVGSPSKSGDLDRNVVLLLSFILIFANQLQHEPAPKWARLVVPIAALVYAVAAFSAPLRRTLFRSGRKDSKVA